MVKLTIDHIPVTVPEGVSVMEAAALNGITIPSMCFRPGLSNHPSCMVCLVKDLDRDHLVPSCAMPVTQGMNIITNSEEVIGARREALELLLSDHAGDCEAPCRLSCPAFMDIPLMNRLIAAGEFEEALRIVREEIALPLILGYICPAPCEKACKRKSIDQPVSICLLKRSTAQYHQRHNKGMLPVSHKNGKTVAIIGTGPAGLSAAFYLIRSGHACVIYDRNDQPGGTLRYAIPEDQLPKEMLDAEIDILRNMGAEFRQGVRITAELFKSHLLAEFDAVILATGNQGENPVDIFGIQPDEHGSYVNRKDLKTTIPGVYACGSVVRELKMAVQSAAQGRLAAHHVELFLGTESGITGDRKTSYPGKDHLHRSVSTIGPLLETEWKEYLKESIPDQRFEPKGGRLAGFTPEEARREAQRCMHCDCRKPVSCKLRLYGEHYAVKRKRFSGDDRGTVTRNLQHELVVYETEKCIRCGICVEITERNGESFGLAFAGRGFEVRISVPFNLTIREALVKTAEACAEACPTGALAFKTREERK
jgi:NADPH-dependent glutamate synthase beta subunit-like oxidoreductase